MRLIPCGFLAALEGQACKACGCPGCCKLGDSGRAGASSGVRPGPSTAALLPCCNVCRGPGRALLLPKADWAAAAASAKGLAGREPPWLLLLPPGPAGLAVVAAGGAGAASLLPALLPATAAAGGRRLELRCGLLRVSALRSRTGGPRAMTSSVPSPASEGLSGSSVAVPWFSRVRLRAGLPGRMLTAGLMVAADDLQGAPSLSFSPVVMVPQSAAVCQAHLLVAAGNLQGPTASGTMLCHVLQQAQAWLMVAAGTL